MFDYVKAFSDSSHVSFVELAHIQEMEASASNFEPLKSEKRLVKRKLGGFFLKKKHGSSKRFSHQDMSFIPNLLIKKKFYT